MQIQEEKKEDMRVTVFGSHSLFIPYSIHRVPRKQILILHQDLCELYVHTRLGY
jgi:hypothetical protein